MFIPITIGFNGNKKIVYDLIKLNDLLIYVESNQLNNLYNSSTLGLENKNKSYDLLNVSFLLKDEQEMKNSYKSIENVHKTLNDRYDLLVNSECKNISEYNESHSKKIKHIVILTYGYPDQKYYNYKQIDSYMSKIMMLGRAAGIHLICITDCISNMSDGVLLNFVNKICSRNDFDRSFFFSCDIQHKLTRNEIFFDCIEEESIRVLKLSLDNCIKEKI